MNMLRKLVGFLRGHDPVPEIDDARELAVRNRIMGQARSMPQEAPRSKVVHQPEPVLSRLWHTPRPHFGWAPQFALGAVVLVLGLWVGQSLDQGTTSQMTVAATQGEQHISVMAMVTPWEGWIEGGE